MVVNNVLFLDGEALVIDKPAGLPVDRPRDGSLSLENQLDSLKFGFKRWPLAVHRLDRDTSGCLLLSRNPKAHARLQQAFEQGLVGKRYLAVLDGVPVVGDPVYGKADPLGMMLHAAELTIPREGKPTIEAKAPLPERFAKAGFGDADTADV